MDEDTLRFVKQVELGLDAQQFFESKLGQELLRRSQEQVLNAFEKWKRSNPEDAKEQRDLQMEVRVAERFPQWIGEMIAKGKSVEDAITEHEE